MRGALTKPALLAEMLGIIPADAGSTPGSYRCRWYTEDHPRGCGEHYPYVDMPYRVRGSSPRMRGAHHGGVLAHVPWGIIPADAGST